MSAPGNVPGGTNPTTDGHVPTPKDQETPASKTTRYIAYILIYGYMSFLLLVLLRAAWNLGANSNDPNAAAWLDLFKTGIALLGGTLTTVIGYFFGQRGTQQAQETATVAKSEAAESDRRRQEAEAAARQAQLQAQSATANQIPVKDLTGIEIPRI